MDLQDRLARADALHTRETTRPSAAQVCRCQQWEVRVPYNATMASIAHEQHRTEALTAAVAAWLREKAADTQAIAELMPTKYELEASGAARMLIALADALVPPANH